MRESSASARPGTGRVGPVGRRGRTKVTGHPVGVRSTARPVVGSVIGVVVGLGMVGLIAVGCASGQRTDSSPAAAASPSTTAGASAKAAGASSNGSQAAGVQALDAPPEQVGRKIVSTATVTVKVDDAVGARERARAGVEAVGGVLYNEQTSVSGRSSSTLTFKVPPERFDGVLADLAKLGKLLGQEVKTDDVTQQVVDLDARIRAAEASLARVTDLVGRTNNVTELASIENEVQRRQADLESLRGQKRTLDARTEMATVVLTLTADEPKAPPAEAGVPGFTDGLRGGWDAFVKSVSVAGAVVGAMLPFLWIPLLVVVVVRLLGRRRRTPAPTGAPAPTT